MIQNIGRNQTDTAKPSQNVDADISPKPRRVAETDTIEPSWLRTSHKKNKKNDVTRFPSSNEYSSVAINALMITYRA